MLDRLESIDFVPLLHQTFCINLDGNHRIELELVSVIELGETLQSGLRNPFSLHFLGPVSSQYLVQHIYRLEHEQMSGLDLFLVPLGPEAGRMRYEAIFT
jgi:hypothetical protein